ANGSAAIQDVFCRSFSRRRCYFFLFPRPPPRSTLFPYTTLFRSDVGAVVVFALQLQRVTAGDDRLKRFRVEQGVVHRLRRGGDRSEEHTSELQSRENLVCRLLLEKKKKAPFKGLRSRPLR